MATNFNTPNAFQLHPGVRQDRFDVIPYVVGDRGTGNVRGIRHSHVFLPQWAMDMVWKRCCVSVSTFGKGDFYTTEELLNDSLLWNKYKTGMHQIFGRCVRYLADHGMLPIECVNPGMSDTKLYRIL